MFIGESSNLGLTRAQRMSMQRQAKDFQRPAAKINICPCAGDLASLGKCAGSKLDDVLSSSDVLSARRPSENKIRVAWNKKNCVSAANQRDPCVPEPADCMHPLPAECMTPEMLKLRDELQKTKAVYMEQVNACRSVAALIKRMEDKNQNQRPDQPHAEKPEAYMQVNPEPHAMPPAKVDVLPTVQEDSEQGVAAPPELQPKPEDDLVHFDVDPQKGSSKGPVPFLKEANEGSPPLLKSSKNMDHAEGYGFFEAQCDTMHNELSHYPKEVPDKNKIITCLEINILRLNRQGQLIARQFTEIEEKFVYIAQQFRSNQQQLATRKDSKDGMLQYAPAKAEFDAPIKELMGKLDADIEKAEAEANKGWTVEKEEKFMEKEIKKEEKDKIRLFTKKSDPATVKKM